MQVHKSLKDSVQDASYISSSLCLSLLLRSCSFISQSNAAAGGTVKFLHPLRQLAVGDTVEVGLERRPAAARWLAVAHFH